MLTHGLFNDPAHLGCLILVPLVEVPLIDWGRSGVRVFIMGDIVVTQAGVLHDKETMSAWLESSKASASKWVVKATGLRFRVL